MRDYVLDRITFSLSVDVEELNIEQSVDAINDMLCFSSSGSSRKTDETMKIIYDAIEMIDKFKTCIMFAMFIKIIILILIILFNLVGLNLLIIIIAYLLFFST